MTRAGLKTNHLPDTNQLIAGGGKGTKNGTKVQDNFNSDPQKMQNSAHPIRPVRHCRQRQRGFRRICHCARLSLYSMSDRFWCGLLFQHFIFMYCRLLP